MSGLFTMRTRKRIELWSLESRLRRELHPDWEHFPDAVIPARTDVAVLDLFAEGALVLAPDGTRAILSGDSIYRPRKPRS